MKDEWRKRRRQTAYALGGVLTLIAALFMYNLSVGGASIEADVSTYWQPFRMRVISGGQTKALIYPNYDSETRTFAYERRVRGYLVYTLYQRGGTCYRAEPGERRAKITTCGDFMDVHEDALPIWSILFFKGIVPGKPKTSNDGQKSI